MSALNRVWNYLDSEKVSYEVLQHPEAYTAPGLARALHVPGRAVAKVVILNVGERFVMAVLPSTWKVDLKRLREIFEPSPVRLATEEEFRVLFPDCDLGAMPPFGNLYGLAVYVDRSMAEDEEIIFPVGNHFQAVKLPYQVFARLVRPIMAEFHVPASGFKIAS